MRKVLLAVAGIFLIIVVGGAVFVASRQHLTFDAPNPDVAASSDSTVIERGRYVVRNLAPCASCHGDPRQRTAFAEGADVPLVGGFEFATAPGRFYTRNLTPDVETGLGNVPDRAIARALRYGVGHDGRALLPFMEMQGLRPTTSSRWCRISRASRRFGIRSRPIASICSEPSSRRPS